MARSLAVLAVLALLQLGLGGCTPTEQSFVAKSEAFSQPLQLTLHGLAPADSGRIADSAIADLHFIAEVSHPWQPGSLGRTNQLLSLTAKFSANPSILPLIDKATRLSAQSHGYYAPAQGKLQQLWGFHSEFPDGPLPKAEAIAELIAANPQMSDIHLEGIRMYSDNPAVRIDFGALPQGYALDTARKRLLEVGVRRARLDNGNAIAVLGDGEQAHLAGQMTVRLRKDEAVITLSTDERGFDIEDRHYHPFLDPNSGYPSEGLLSVSVLHPSAASAAAYAQALLAGGRGKLAELMKVIPVEYVLAVTDKGEILLSDGLKRRLTTVQQ